MSTVFKYALLLTAAGGAGVIATVLFAPTTQPEPRSLVLEEELPAAPLPAQEIGTEEPLESATTSAEMAVETPLIEETVAGTTTEPGILGSVTAQQAVAAPVPELLFPTQGVFAPFNDAARAASVNIICQRRDGKRVHTTTGSGIIIDPRGVVLTNAHVADLFLLKGERSVGSPVCAVRMGNPAETSFEAELIFLPRRWIEAFAPSPTDPEPRGTGEEDFALLRLTDAVGDNELPETFPFIPFSVARDAVGLKEQVLISGYPALAHNTGALRDSLYLVSTLTKVLELFTFDGKNLDLITLSGNIASAQGSSGAAVVNDEGNLIGIVVASSRANLTLERHLRALSLNHINRRLEAQTGKTLEGFLEDDIEMIAQSFAENDLPLLKKKLLSDAE